MMIRVSNMLKSSRLIVASTTLLAFAAISFAQTTPAVDITAKTKTYTRQKPISEWKKEFTIDWPKVIAKTPALSRKIEALLNYEKLFDFTIKEELSEIQWLEKAYYEVCHNKGKTLCVAMSIEGSGAYPDGLTKYLVINTATGTQATAATEFTATPKLASLLNQKLQAEIKEQIKQLKDDKDNADIEPAELFRGKRFTAKDLDGFSVNDDGVTFRYQYNFVHAVQALEPSGEFTMTWKQLKPYLRPGSLLASMAR